MTKKTKTWDVAYAVSDEDYLTDEELYKLRFEEGIRKCIKEKLRECRKNRRVTQKQVSEMTGISESDIKKFEAPNVKAEPDVFELARLSDYYGYGMDYFCRDKIKKNDKERAIRYTGLSEKAVSYLHRLKPDERDVLNRLLSDRSGFTDLIHALKDAAIAQQVVDATERDNDGIERRVNDILNEGLPEYSPGSVAYEVQTREANEVLKRLDQMLTSNINALEVETAAKDLVIRKFYNVLEKFADDVSVSKWTRDYKAQISDRIHKYCVDLFVIPSVDVSPEDAGI